MNKKTIVPIVILGVIFIGGGVLFDILKAKKADLGPSIKIGNPFKVSVYGGGEHDEGETFDFRVEVSKEREYFIVRTKERPQYYSWDSHHVVLSDDSWSVETIEVGTRGDSLIPKSSTILGGTNNGSAIFIGKTPLTCDKKGRDAIMLPRGVRIEFTFKSNEAIPQLADKKIPGEGNKYKVQVEKYFAPNNTLLYVECTEVKGGFTLLHQCFACNSVSKGGICMPSMVGSKEECDKLGGKFIETKIEQ